MHQRTCTLITCSGVSNTGRVTTQAASILIRRNPELFDCHITANQATIDLLRELEHADCLVVIEGCPDQCAAKKLGASGIEPEIHIIATEHGIEKKGMDDVEFWEIERLIQAILEAVRS